MKFTIVILIFVCGIIGSIKAQQVRDSTSRWHSNNILKINAIGLVSKFIELSFERVITNSFSAAVTYGNGRTRTISGEDAKKNYMDKYHSFVSSIIVDNTEQKITVKQHLSFEGRFYLSYKNTKIPAGFHLAPSLNFLSYEEQFIFYDKQGLEVDRRENKYKVVSFNIGIGPQFLIHRIISIDAFIAPGYGTISQTDSGLRSSSEKGYSGAGFILAYGLFCGIAFGK